MTELSSIGHHFTRQFVLGGWLFVALCLLGLSWRALGAYLTAASRSRGAIQPVRWVSQALRTEETFWLLIPAFYFGVFVYLALAYLPSNGDSLDYHLARRALDTGSERWSVSSTFHREVDVLPAD